MEARGDGDLINMDWLTMFADYRVPQALVYLGVLRYSDALMQALKSGEKRKRARTDFPCQEQAKHSKPRDMCSYSSSSVPPRGAAHFRRQEGGGDPRLFHLVCGANQRAPLEARARERRTNLQRQLGNHRLLPVALRQAAPQRDGPHSHTPHTLYILLTGCEVCSSCADASSWDEAKLISGPNV